MDPGQRSALCALVVQLRRELSELPLEVAYRWANRLLALRCLEARELCDEVVVQRSVYGGRSLEHHRLAQRHPELCTGEDDGLFDVFERAFAARAATLPRLFAGTDPRPSVVSLQRIVALLSGQPTASGAGRTTDELFRHPTALGWAYQFWNAEQKDLLFEAVRKRGRKVGGADLVAATQLYTAPHLVAFLVQNSLGAIWMAMHPSSPLAERWPYFVSTADAPRLTPKPVAELRVLDPACGSGHFLLEAFELLYEMYEQEGVLSEPGEICRCIIERNLFGIDIDPRAIQIAEALLWMKAAEKTFDHGAVRANLVTARSVPGCGPETAELFGQRHPETRAGRRRLRRLFRGLGAAGELGALLALSDEPPPAPLDPSDGPLFAAAPELGCADPLLEQVLQFLAENDPAGRTSSFESGTPASGEVPARREAVAELRPLVRLLGRRFDAVVMNPPYAGFRTLDPELKGYLAQTEPDAALDLYVAFLSRFFGSLRPGGLLAAVTPASWTTSMATTALRRRVLREGGPVAVAALGQRVFEAAPLLFVALQVLGRGQRSDGGHFVTLRPSVGSGASGLRQCAAAGGRRWPCRLVAQLESAPFLPVAPLELLDTAAERPSLSSFFTFVDGIWTGHTDRDVREGWEVEPGDGRWVVASGGQGYGRWYASTRRRVRAEHVGRWRERVERSVGIEYPRVAGGNLCGRALWPQPAPPAEGRAETSASVALAGVVTLVPKPGIVPERIEEVAAVFNGRIGALWLRTLSSGLNFNPGYAARIPLGPSAPEGSFVALVREAVRLKGQLARFDPTGDDFEPSLLLPDESTGAARFAGQRVAEQLELAAQLLEVEEQVDAALALHLGLGPSSRAAIDGELGIPVAAHPRSPRPATVTGSRGAAGALPADHPIESVAAAHAVHPRTVVAAALTETEEEGSDHGGMVAAARALGRDAERRLWADYLTTVVLRLFHHRWPLRQLAASVTSAPSVAPAILCLGNVFGESPAIELVRRSLEQDFSGVEAAETERTISRGLGQRLERWLQVDFFSEHVKRYRRRPLIWQLASCQPARRRAPALTVWLYARRIDADTLPKVRTQYLGPLRQRVAASLAAHLGGSEEDRWKRASMELDAFDERLATVVAEGFDQPTLAAQLATEPLDGWCASRQGAKLPPDAASFAAQERQYRPLREDGFRVNVAPLQRASLLARDVLAARDVEDAIAARARWRAETRQRGRRGETARLPWWEELAE